jgi:hypothetical protein
MRRFLIGVFVRMEAGEQVRGSLRGRLQFVPGVDDLAQTFFASTPPTIPRRLTAVDEMGEHGDGGASSYLSHGRLET